LQCRRVRFRPGARIPDMEEEPQPVGAGREEEPGADGNARRGIPGNGKAARRAQAVLDRIERRREIHKQLHWVPRVIVVTFGFLILLAGLAMLVLPGPAILVIPIGLAILSLEFLWAEMLLDRALESGVSFGGWLGRAVRNRQLVLATAAVLGAAAVIVFTIVI
jgi:uncharacterized protein (TIGR02611 family)